MKVHMEVILIGLFIFLIYYIMFRLLSNEKTPPDILEEAMDEFIDN
jgi:phosphotransferase system  glucose/maltose/N-acetylglucosamine-specific IIC component